MSVTRTLLNGTAWQSSLYYGGSGYVRVILADGSLLWFRTNVEDTAKFCYEVDGDYSDICGVFFYDVNGNSAPNTLAKDAFIYQLRPSGVYPTSNSTCYLNGGGWSCSKWILENDNMDYPATKPTK